MSKAELAASYFEGLKANLGYKGINETNPLMTQRFGADPYAMEYDGRVYFYMTADSFEYDAAGNVKENSYSTINTINVISTDDMVNFTDHGAVYAAGPNGAAKWARNSWAPAAAWKMMNGKPKFFLYFADAGGGIGVLTSDSPTGPFVDPLGKGLITRDMPNCGNVLWLFDPAVLVDDDGKAYIYFGGGVPQDKISAPGTGRVAQLSESMIGIEGEPVALDVPYLFEDSGIHKYGNKYYYTYCSNWQVDAEGTAKYGFTNAEIISMESDSPMGPFVFKEKILENPGKYCGLYGNNHHCVFSFKDEWYIAYHTRMLEKKMGIEHGYRATSVDKFEMGEDGTIGIIKQTTDGREQLKYVDAYAKNQAVTMAVMSGLETKPLTEKGSDMILTGIDSGDFMKVQGVDFGDTTPAKLNAMIRTTAEKGEKCAIQVRIDKMYGDVIGYVYVEDSADFANCQTVLEKEVTGVHDLFFIFSGNGYEMESWSFEK
ncbi:MAG: carbohydrate-binding protein [Lachnospiraceae bacterium]|nr:carbohydrate-binding protein [Lachnospiraceae bacterium]